MNKEILEFYSRPEIQREIVLISKNREVAIKFSDKGFGKRPDILQFEGDVLDYAKQGATSFHISEERWSDPLKLIPGMTKKQLDSLRHGWDLVLDIDCKVLEYSKIAASIIIDALKFHDVENISVKFSGSSGFHIGIPFEAFPEKVNNVETRLLFPEGAKVIASYLKYMIHQPTSIKILEHDSIEKIKEKTGKTEKELHIENSFNPYSFLGIDTVLISNRHLFRAPYSFNEKSGLISIPIKPEDILKFDKSQALPKNVKTNISFLKPTKKNDASNLIIQAFDWQSRSNKPSLETKQPREFEKIKGKISEKYFPPCIKLILKGVKEDGRKRALFILLNFLKSTGYEMNDLVSVITKWNQKNYEPLKEGYIQSQISWFRRQKEGILPPNCSNSAYYKDLLICKPDIHCRKIKNPVNYSTKKLYVQKKQK